MKKKLKCNPGEKSLKAPFVIYLDLECLSMRLLVGQCLQNVHLTKKEINLIIVEEKNCIEKLCKKLKKRAMKIINYEEKEMTPLAYGENKSFKEQEACHICEEKFFIDEDDENYKNRKKVKDQCHYTGIFRGAAHRKCNLNYKVPKDVPIIIHNASYDTNFIISQSAEEFNGEIYRRKYGKIYHFFCTN